MRERKSDNERKKEWDSKMVMKIMERKEEEIKWDVYRFE